MYSSFELLDLFDQGRYHLECVPYDTVVSSLKERGLRVSVYHDDDLRLVDTGQVLDSAGDAYSDIEVRLDREACLSYVLMVRPPVHIRYGT